MNLFLIAFFEAVRVRFQHIINIHVESEWKDEMKGEVV
jgi:hypothetical protein